MKFFHLSDLHIGLKLMNRDLQEDQKYIFKQIAELAAKEQPDVVVIAGDIYDKAVPAAEAVELFDEFISALTEAMPQGKIMMISGNHDSAVRVNVFRHILRRQGVYMIGLPPQTKDEFIEKITLNDEHGAVNFYLLPFVKPSRLRAVLFNANDSNEDDGENEREELSYDESVRRLLAREKIEQSERNVLVSHQFYLPAGRSAVEVERMDSEICTVGNIDEIFADVLEPFDYAALGHIHKPMKVKDEVYRYSGTPLACSVSEAGQQKAVLSVTLGAKGDISVTALPLTPLRQIRIIRGTAEEVLAKACDDYVTVILNEPAVKEAADLPDRLRQAFPYLLEIRRALPHTPGSAPPEAIEKTNPLELIYAFLTETDDAERAILQDVINTVKEASE